MKKQLFSAVAALAFGSVVAQVSPSWSITQNASFSITSAGVRYLDAVDPNVVWLIGYDGTAPNRNYNWYSRTTNGGTSYNSGNVFADTNTYQISNIDGIDANTAWVAAFNKVSSNLGVIYRTTNGGANWTNMTGPGMFTNTASFANMVVFLTPNNGVAQGDPVNGDFEIWTTTNGGTSWSQVPGANIPPPLSQEYSIINLYAKEGTTNMWFGTNKGRVYYSTNSGNTWNVSSLTNAPSTSTVTEIAFTNATTGLAYVAVGPAATATTQVYRTTDGGATWSLTTSNDPDMGLNDICGIPGTGFFASVGAGSSNQVISYSTDNGTSWTSWGGTGIQYLNVDFVDAMNGWAGSFSDQANPAVDGIFKFAGVNAAFSLPSVLCLNSTTTVSPVNLSTGSNLTYSWSAVQNSVVFSSVTATVPVITFSATGTYVIKLTATNNLGVVMTTSQTINVLTCTTPTANFNIPGSACNNVAFNLTNSSTGTPAPDFTITTSAVSGVTVTNPSGPAPITVKFATPGTYTITSTATNLYGTGSTSSVIVVQDCSPIAGFSLTPNPLCLTGAVGTASAVQTTSASGATYIWTIVPNTATVNTLPNNSRKYTFSPADGNIGTYTITLVVSNASGSTSAVQVLEVTSCITGVNENGSLFNNLNVYPNPAFGKLYLTLPASMAAYKIKMINLIGAIVYEEQTVNNSNTVSINLNSIPKGIYFLSVESDKDKAIKKIIVE